MVNEHELQQRLTAAHTKKIIHRGFAGIDDWIAFVNERKKFEGKSSKHEGLIEKLSEIFDKHIDKCGQHLIEISGDEHASVFFSCNCFEDDFVLGFEHGFACIGNTTSRHAFSDSQRNCFALSVLTTLIDMSKNSISFINGFDCYVTADYMENFTKMLAKLTRKQQFVFTSVDSSILSDTNEDICRIEIIRRSKLTFFSIFSLFIQ